MDPPSPTEKRIVDDPQTLLCSGGLGQDIFYLSVKRRTCAREVGRVSAQ